jgi:hypothetical protein
VVPIRQLLLGVVKDSRTTGQVYKVSGVEEVS